ncbi:hypothetical protein ACVJBD_002099 [Rhizobium mongolense]
MARYAVYLRRPVEQVGHLTIEDNRSMADLANTLQSVGYILTEEVTTLGGRPARAKQSTIFLRDVSRIQPE